MDVRNVNLKHLAVCFPFPQPDGVVHLNYKVATIHNLIINIFAYPYNDFDSLLVQRYI